MFDPARSRRRKVAYHQGSRLRCFRMKQDVENPPVLVFLSPRFYHVAKHFLTEQLPKIFKDYFWGENIFSLPDSGRPRTVSWVLKTGVFKRNPRFLREAAACQRLLTVHCFTRLWLGFDDARRFLKIPRLPQIRHHMHVIEWNRFAAADSPRNPCAHC